MERSSQLRFHRVEKQGRGGKEARLDRQEWAVRGGTERGMSGGRDDRPDAEAERLRLGVAGNFLLPRHSLLLPFAQLQITQANELRF